MTRSHLVTFTALLAALSSTAPSFSEAGVAGPEPSQEVRELVGVWAGRRDFGPEVEGLLTLERRGSDWHAEIAGYRVAAQAHDDSVSFSLPGGGGSFVGRLELASGNVRGQWIQPGVVAMFGQRFSTPVLLLPVGPTLWQGTVQPLADVVSLFFVLESGDSGEIRAFLRNPEVNFGRFFDFVEVQRRGESVEFLGSLAWEEQGEPRVLLNAVYREEEGRLSVFVEDLGGTYDLERLDADSVSSFYPRARALLSRGTVPPPPLPDGWRTATLRDVDMAPEPIEALIRDIETTSIDALDSPYVEAVLVARHGRLVLEQYFHGHSRSRAHDTRSASKSLTATLVGAAIRAGEVALDTRVYPAMATDASPGTLDPRASRMTLEHLVTMTSGLSCDDWDSDSPGGEDRVQNQPEQSDWNAYLLDLPMRHEPGEHAAYCSVGMSLAGAVVAKEMELPLTEAFDRLLALPLQMGTYHTNLMPNGEAYAGGGLRLTARDFLKFGQLMLDDGEWNARRILEPGWAEAALQRRHDLGGERFGSYGFGWWLIDYEVDGRRWEAFYAGGNGGNYIIGIPELDLAIVFQASNYNQAIQHETKLELVPRFIIRSALDGDSDSPLTAGIPR